MKKFLIEVFKLVAAASGPACIVYANKLSQEYFALGKQSPDGIHTVLVNNHGVYKYITESQDQHVNYLLGAGALLLPVLFALIVLKIRKDRRNRLGLD